MGLIERWDALVMDLGLAPRSMDTTRDELLDADLAVRARPRETCAAYVEAVRTEHGHLDEASFCTGRAAVLTALGDRAWLFYSSGGAARFEAVTRANLARELVDLVRMA